MDHSQRQITITNWVCNNIVNIIQSSIEQTKSMSQKEIKKSIQAIKIYDEEEKVVVEVALKINNEIHHIEYVIENAQVFSFQKTSERIFDA